MTQKLAGSGKMARLAWAAVLGLGMAVSPFAMAERGAEQCSASVQRGSMPSLTTTGRRSRIINSPLLEENSYLSVTLPESYMSKVVRAARERPESGRREFVAEILQRNVQTALARRSGSFDCAPLTDSFAPPADRPADAGQQPPPRDSRPPEDAGVPAQDSGDGGQRGRVIRP